MLASIFPGQGRQIDQQIHERALSTVRSNLLRNGVEIERKQRKDCLCAFTHVLILIQTGGGTSLHSSRLLKSLTVINAEDTNAVRYAKC